MLWVLDHPADSPARSSAWRRAGTRPAPCNILAGCAQAQAVKKGVASGRGAPPREILHHQPSPDGIAMGHERACASSLPFARNAIADSVELTITRPLAMTRWSVLAGCDKSLPGMMMAMVPPQRAVDFHLWRPRSFPGNFPRPAGHRAGHVRGGRQAIRSARLSDADLDEIERVACPFGWRVAAHNSTANTMATVSEAIGLALPVFSRGAGRLTKSAMAFCTTAGPRR